MKPKKWDTLKLALYGAPVGAAVTFLRDADTLAGLNFGQAAALVIGGAIGGMALFAIVSGLRNLLVR